MEISWWSCSACFWFSSWRAGLKNVLDLLPGETDGFMEHTHSSQSLSYNKGKPDVMVYTCNSRTLRQKDCFEFKANQWVQSYSVGLHICKKMHYHWAKVLGPLSSFYFERGSQILGLALNVPSSLASRVAEVIGLYHQAWLIAHFKKGKVSQFSMWRFRIYMTKEI